MLLAAGNKLAIRRGLTTAGGLGGLSQLRWLLSSFRKVGGSLPCASMMWQLAFLGVFELCYITVRPITAKGIKSLSPFRKKKGRWGGQCPCSPKDVKVFSTSPQGKAELHLMKTQAAKGTIVEQEFACVTLFLGGVNKYVIIPDRKLTMDQSNGTTKFQLGEPIIWATYRSMSKKSLTGVCMTQRQYITANPTPE